VNILVLCYEYPPIGGGGGVGAKQYAEAWAQKGHKVTVLTSWARGLNTKEMLNNVHVLRVRTFGRGSRATATFVSMLSYIVFGYLYVLLNRQEFRNLHIVNTHFAIPTGPLGHLVSKTLRIPNVLTIIGGDIYDPSKASSPHRNVVMRRLNSFLINSADSIVAISHDTRSRAERYYRIKKEIKVINYGFVPVPLPKPEHVRLNRDDGQYYLIAVGRLVRRKGFEYLIHSLELLPATVHLIIIGDGPMEKYLQEVARTNRVSDRVIFAGYVSRDRIYEYLQNADCFVLPSLHEGLGIVVQEAMYAGLPIVCTNNGGQTDLVKEPRNGLLIQAGDVEMLATAITRLYEGRELRKEVGENNKEDIKKYYITVNCEEYVRVFEELTGEAASVRGERVPAGVKTASTRKGDSTSAVVVGTHLRD
jgi:glycosyltransferase involved in cell wall biosynthesis